jgi:hypothetical protein
VAIGWGITEERRVSDELMQVSLDIIKNVDCATYFDEERGLEDGIIDSQVCAGVLTGGKDTCRGG